MWRPFAGAGASTTVDCRHRLVKFDGKTQHHATEPFSGRDRFTCVIPVYAFMNKFTIISLA